MKVKDIMTKDPACCTPESNLSDVARLMVQRDCGEIPVVENQTTMKPVGVVTDRDIVIRALAHGRDPMGMTAREVMSSPAVTVTPETGIEDCCKTLEARRVRRVPVVNESGGCCGMVSQADVAKHASEKMTADVVRTVSQSRRA